ncbi:uncharacterized protein N7482_001032 [Penicillium canariense]|uniref:Nascent polypeptide-associated complex subunit alpha-like UBA domain-containing protein n=1 Tax=Penicillium canariense TaxID=189055 RepID=A0A9W9IDB7_9EURO|nr:uncharacterized protein N7482_001032 [Penicillium canariense]KAJ5175155.1 hypothetical protein N7482_001032 [Penicillium canariense]
MSDPIPSASADPHAVDQPLPANAEDRMAAAALSSLNTNGLAGDAPSSKGPSSADQEALSKAMSRLEVASGQDTGKRKVAEAKKKEAEVKKKAVKILAADVTLLADQLDLHKNKATELLRAHEGDVTRAMKDFVAPSIHT